MSVQIPPPQCMYCVHWRPGQDHPLGLQTCAAFPDGIPDEIWSNEQIHDSGPTPHFEPKPEFEDMSGFHDLRNKTYVARLERDHPELFEEEESAEPGF